MSEVHVEPGAALRGSIAVPGDKSISHRALLLNGLARGSARVRGLARSGDVDATARVLRLLGVEVAEGVAEVVVRAPADGLVEPASVLDCGNSGTTLRLLVGALAPCPLFAVLSGDASLRRRPMRRVVEPLRAMGADIDGRGDGALAPLALRGGKLGPGQHDLALSSAQVKSALLLAGRRAGVRVREPRQSRDHTERMLRAMGASLDGEAGWLVLAPKARLDAVDVDVPGDLSAAAFPLVAACLVPGSDIVLERVGVNPTRSGVLDALTAMGAHIERSDRDGSLEPRADLRARHGPLRGIEIAGDLALRCLDELPVLAVAAAFAEGRTVISDAAELRVKESDRIARVAQGLTALGVSVTERPDGLIIEGGRPRGPARVDATGDHRIAMAFAVAGLAAPGGVRIAGSEAVDSSYPAFFEHIRDLCRRGRG